jgi:hypothetical protein
MGFALEKDTCFIPLAWLYFSGTRTLACVLVQLGPFHQDLKQTDGCKFYLPSVRHENPTCQEAPKDRVFCFALCGA